MSFLTEILLIAAIAVQCVAMYYALRLVRKTKYNSVWILFIIGCLMLLLMIMLLNRHFVGRSEYSTDMFIVMGSVISLCLSVSVMYAHRLFGYIDRLNRRQELFNKRLLTAVLRTEEKSRAHFAKELHDGMGPLLSSVKMSLTALKYEQRPERRSQLNDNTLMVIEEAIRSLREISNNMQPQVLKDFGLERALRNFIDRSGALRNISLHFKTDLGERRFDPDIEVIVYRVVCEFIHNSLKHSGCGNITLELHCDEAMLAVHYADDGCGFDINDLPDAGMGLSNISSRIKSVNGTFTLESAKGNGMRADIELSLGDN